jgi:hypothetical protein
MAAARSDSIDAIQATSAAAYGAASQVPVAGISRGYPTNKISALGAFRFTAASTAPMFSPIDGTVEATWCPSRFLQGPPRIPGSETSGHVRSRVLYRPKSLPPMPMVTTRVRRLTASICAGAPRTASIRLALVAPPQLTSVTGRSSVVATTVG